MQPNPADKSSNGLQQLEPEGLEIDLLISPSPCCDKLLLSIYPFVAFVRELD